MRLRNALAIALLLLLSACASLPENYPREESWKLDGDGTRLETAFESEIAAHPGESGAYPISSGMAALAARVMLARTAERTLDVQYYIWHSDESGLLLLKEVLDAADRGVRVRVLIDDIGVGRKDDRMYRLLDSHPNIHLSLYNPIASRGSRTLGLVSNAWRLNHRMHNKSMTADGTLTIVGGRNVGNEYFSLNELVNFADLDVLAVGPVADQVADSFDLFWNSPSSFPVTAFHKDKVNPEEYAEARRKLDDYVARKAGPYYEAMAQTSFGPQLNTAQLHLFWGKITALFDSPEKPTSNGESDVLLKQLTSLLGVVETDLVIVSPYFVPGKQGVQALVGLAQRGVRVRVLTNSLASTDVAAVHAGYKKSRRDLLEGGVELYEMMPYLNDDSEVVREFSFSGSSAASLHAKMFIADQQEVFIGSMNLDPRSVAINTEIGLLIDSPALATLIDLRFDITRDDRYYTLQLEPAGGGAGGGHQRIVWIEHENGEEIRFTKDPESSCWKRFKVNLISLLPVDSQL